MCEVVPASEFIFEQSYQCHNNDKELDLCRLNTPLIVSLFPSNLSAQFLFHNERIEMNFSIRIISIELICKVVAGKV